jgi:hypothetical protein
MARFLRLQAKIPNGSIRLSISSKAAIQHDI